STLLLVERQRAKKLQEGLPHRPGTRAIPGEERSAGRCVQAQRLPYVSHDDLPTQGRAFEDIEATYRAGERGHCRHELRVCRCRSGLAERTEIAFQLSSFQPLLQIDPVDPKRIRETGEPLLDRNVESMKALQQIDVRGSVANAALDRHAFLEARVLNPRAVPKRFSKHSHWRLQFDAGSGSGRCCRDRPHSPPRYVRRALRRCPLRSTIPIPSPGAGSDALARSGRTRTAGSPS